MFFFDMFIILFFVYFVLFFFFKQKTAYEMRISDWSSDVCSSDLRLPHHNSGRWPPVRWPCHNGPRQRCDRRQRSPRAVSRTATSVRANHKSPVSAQNAGDHRSQRNRADAGSEHTPPPPIG